jgi:tRNA nucleotidyltransferase (CCA-adding enzyme)
LKIYVVGGAIRDNLLGLPAADRDYVVVGSSPEEMMAKGFIPVGQDFPVFLHPHTKEEYALARTERKSGQGYKGFTFYTSPDVTLEQDLIRRDFTVNAMAQEINADGDYLGPVIDPYGGQKDLASHLFRHVSDAFKEDPLRILRLGRFLARFKGFSVEASTLSLVKEMVQKEELQFLVPERIWQELSRGLLESKPSRMLDFLSEIAVNDSFLPKHLFNPIAIKNTGNILDQLAVEYAPLEFRLAVLLCELDSTLAENWQEHNKVPTDLKNFTRGYRLVSQHLKTSTQSAQDYLTLFDTTDLWRKSSRFQDFIKLAKLLGLNTVALEKVTLRVQEVNSGEIAQGVPSRNGKDIAQAVATARLTAIASVL